MDKEHIKIGQEAIKIIEQTLEKGDRVELTPLKGYVKISRVRRNELKTELYSRP